MAKLVETKWTDSENIEFLQKEILTLNRYISEVPEDVKAMDKRNQLSEELTALQNKSLFENQLKKLGRNRIEEIIAPATEPAVIIILEPADLKVLNECFTNAIGIANFIDNEESRFSYLALKTKIATQLFSQNSKL